MIVHWCIVLIYVSFLFELLIWKVPSEASTRQLVESSSSTGKRILWVMLFVLSFAAYLAPLALTLLEMYQDRTDYLSGFRISGLVVAILGRLISMKAASILHTNPPENLVMDSIFKYSRNPINLGMFITLFGLVLIYQTWFLWLGLVIFIINLHLKILIEEHHLQTLFGEDFIDYKARTARYLGYAAK